MPCWDILGMIPRTPSCLGLSLQGRYNPLRFCRPIKNSNFRLKHQEMEHQPILGEYLENLPHVASRTLDPDPNLETLSWNGFEILRNDLELKIEECLWSNVTNHQYKFIVYSTHENGKVGDGDGGSYSLTIMIWNDPANAGDTSHLHPPNTGPTKTAKLVVFSQLIPCQFLRMSGTSKVTKAILKRQTVGQTSEQYSKSLYHSVILVGL